MPNEIRVSSEARETTVDLRAGDTIVLSLKENPTTGYRWSVAADGFEPVAEDYEIARDAGAGGGGTRTFRFIARVPGSGDIRAVLRRAWEPEHAAVDSRTIHARIT